MSRTIRKSRTFRTITGTLGGIAEHFKLDYAWLRLSFALLVIITKGWAILFYLILFLLLPAPKVLKAQTILGPLDFQESASVRFFRLVKTDLGHVFARHTSLFGFVFLSLGVLWFAMPLNAASVMLLIGGTVLLFDPFGLRRRLSANIFYDHFQRMDNSLGDLPGVSIEDDLMNFHMSRNKARLPQA
ncbi:MAG: hypothetical protein A3J48_01355 [Candidatus Doudnabacteria bacterium RIFCSPHIGHO2_02_FULL_46_11]|uniref:Phage shock protein PspC N-terminal domain-containing protein n=1 Tax=Candidatus Doudnabacteria bacterium RIFCSPHIGHO2_02_FULL_46_11 TaxID=1817832 RepID=A0A1F5P916_9BACT|nr:MAG: hypothetical protein A3J48_01355 [Candidatus Doudnabacteria bacterium RIFCSPHIGHO2_02_FULL_46_11]